MKNECPFNCPICNNETIGNIRDIRKFIRSLWPWDIFNNCFPGKIRFSDLDGIVERNGHCLIMEGKGIENNHRVPIPRGQEIMFKHMIETGYISIFILWGKIPGQPEKFQAWSVNPGITLPTNSDIDVSLVRNCDLDEIKWRVRKWYEWANNQRR